MSKELTKKDVSSLFVEGVKLYKIGLMLPEDLTFDNWLKIIEVVKKVEGCVQWWLGDALNFGERKYGEKYSQALDETEYEYGTLRNICYVSNQIEMSLRSDNLTWHHHKEVAVLSDKNEQAKFLEIAERDNLSVRELRKAVRDYKKSITSEPLLPEGKFRVFYADPPWQYSDELIEGYGSAEHHYPTLTLEELCEKTIKDIAYTDSVLFLWATSPLLDDVFKVIEAWGFEYKTSFVWDKVKHNYGHYNSVRHEFLLLCTRGSYLPSSDKLFDSVITLERTEKHSEKPAYFRELIETLYPVKEKERIELFARKKIPGWTCWGNELQHYKT